MHIFDVFLKSEDGGAPFHVASVRANDWNEAVRWALCMWSNVYDVFGDE